MALVSEMVDCQSGIPDFLPANRFTFSWGASP
jgi:hypothetical protein